MNRLLRSFVTCAMVLGAAATRTDAQSTLRLSRLFADGVVLQRSHPIAIWGWSAPNARVTVQLDGARASAPVRAVADAKGAWRASLPARSAGGPYALRVESGTEHLTVRDVLIGDLWLASGQSNMEFTLSNDADARHAVAAANDSLLRQFKVPNSWSDSPESELTGGSWTRADPAHAGEFSAVGYYFGRELRTSTKVPIGIINSTWGGSNIETWISRGAQQITDSAWRAMRRNDSVRVASARTALRARLGALPETDAGLVNGAGVWARTDLLETDWGTVPVPAYWEPHGYPDMDGVAWYRTSFELSAQEIERGVTLSMIAIDDDDITWLNGVEVGRTNGYNVARSYRLPATALRAGRNVLAVRVSDGTGGGGINAEVALLIGGTKRSLAGDWKFKVGKVTFGDDGQRINKIPSVLYNRMIHPMAGLSLAGVIWYQGESNANNVEQAAAYRATFQTLISSWRREFGARAAAKPLPFLWVQLPNFGALEKSPPRSSSWATQRESMDAALVLPATGRAIAIDVGEADDIHPRNKRDPGVRLARVAQHVAYGAPVAWSGPTYKSHTTLGDTIVVTFDHVGAGLVNRTAGTNVPGFVVAASDGAFVVASARVVGNRVHVWSDRVRAPKAVRYAWANNPGVVGLFNRDSLPAAPFRTDRW